MRKGKVVFLAFLAALLFLCSPMGIFRGDCAAEESLDLSIGCEEDVYHMARVLVYVTDCGNLCGQAVQAAIVAVSPEGDTYSWTPAEGWVTGLRQFAVALGLVSGFDVLYNYSVYAWEVSGWTVYLGVDQDGDGRVTVAEAVSAVCPEVNNPCLGLDMIQCEMNSECMWDMFHGRCVPY